PRRAYARGCLAMRKAVPATQIPGPLQSPSPSSASLPDFIVTRLPITKTPKVYVGGAFIRSESGRVRPLHDRRGRLVGHVPQCTRKDVRNAVEAAAKAGPGWARRTPYIRGQILYRLAEMLESRAGELAAALARTGGTSARAASREVATTCDRVVYYAGWADKF